ncbi:hypothetical protein Hanom_Chr04g00328431 [Helianthus anomalus]
MRGFDRRFGTIAPGANSYAGTVSGLHQGLEQVKVVEVSDFVRAFDEFHNLAIVGRLKDLWSLRKIGVSVIEEGFRDVNIKYTCGLDVLLVFKSSFEVDAFCANALEFSWFQNLEIWIGQLVAFERIAWLKIHGVPLHLADNEVFDSIGRRFGRYFMHLSCIWKTLISRSTTWGF